MGSAVTSAKARTGLLACALGFLHGALVYGVVLAVLHVEYNAVASLRDALITGFFFALLYGAWAALFCGVAYLVTSWRGSSEEPGIDKAQLTRAVSWGLLAFHLVFWELYFLYGLTYDQIPAPLAEVVTGGFTMLLYLLVAGVFIASIVALATWLYLKACLFLAARGRLRSAIVVAAVAGLLILTLTAARMQPAPTEELAAGEQITEASDIEVVDTGVKVALIGLDGADWRVMDPMLEGGELPTFSALQQQGTRASLETLPDANSAVIWASMYTGATPREHTIHDFYRIELPGMVGPGLYPVHRTYFKELAGLLEKVGLARRTTVSRFSLARSPIWEIADHAGLSLGLVDGYFYSFPALQVSHPDSFFLAYGLDTFNESLSSGGASPREIPYFVQPENLFRRVRGGLDGGDFEWQRDALFELLSDHPQPQLLNFYTHEPDSTQHWTWKWHEPEAYLMVDAAEVEQRGEEIHDLYRDFDAFLGRLRRTLGPDTVLVIASDHGHSATLAHEYYTQHRHGPPGILLMTGGPLRQGLDLGPDAHVYDLVPTLLHLLGLPVPEDAAGRVLEEALSDDFRQRFPVRTVPAYDLPGLGGLLQDGLSDSRNQQELDKLKSLGYI